MLSYYHPPLRTGAGVEPIGGVAVVWPGIGARVVKPGAGVGCWFGTGVGLTLPPVIEP